MRRKNLNALLATAVLLLGVVHTVFAEPLWPLRAGRWYRYYRSDSSARAWTVQLEVGRQIIDDSFPYFKIQAWNYNNDSKSDDWGYIRSTEEAVYEYNQNGEDYLERKKAPAGAKWSFYQRHNSGFNYQVVEIVDINQVRVPYGEFAEAYETRKYRCVDPEDLGKGKSPDSYEWIVPGIGLVRQVDYRVDGSARVILELARVYPVGDLNGDHWVDFSDLVILAERWLRSRDHPQGMVFIPGGEFMMGDSFDEGDADERPVHLVKVGSFYMSRYEITSQKYCEYLNSAKQQGIIEARDGVVYAVSGKDPYCDMYEYDSDSRISFDGNTFTVLAGKEDHPMVEVSWYGAAAYCNWLSSENGYDSCYNPSTWNCDFSKSGYRLPTEAEWEYAARGGLSSMRYPWANNIDGSKANYSKSEHPYRADPYPWTTPVGYYNGRQTPAGPDMANGFGLYDMAGNVWEWCNDWFNSGYYSVSPSDNPTGPAGGRFRRRRRAIRGGAWVSGVNGCRAASRSNHYPELRSTPLGFRVALDLN